MRVRVRVVYDVYIGSSGILLRERSESNGSGDDDRHRDPYLI